VTIADAGLRKVVQHHLHKSQGWLWTPVETAGTRQGVPDTHWAHIPSFTSGWVEHKATHGWAVTVRPHQIAWIDLHMRAGVHCLIMVRAMGVGSSHDRGDSLWVIDGAAIKALAEKGLNGIPGLAVLGRWCGELHEWNWPAVQQLMTGRQHDR